MSQSLQHPSKNNEVIKKKLKKEVAGEKNCAVRGVNSSVSHHDIIATECNMMK